MKTCTKAKLWIVALLATVSFLTWCTYTDGNVDNLWQALLTALVFIAFVALCIIFGWESDKRNR